MKSIEFSDFKTAGESFLRGLVSDLNALALPTQTLTCDHLCFRVSNNEEYENYKHLFSDYGKLLTEALVNGRPICTFFLQIPFKTDHHEVWLLELPAPKPGVFYQTGFEHAEFVIVEDFKTFCSKFPHLTFKEAGSNTLNPELCLKLEGKQAKFHHLPLDRVIELEEADAKGTPS